MADVTISQLGQGTPTTGIVVPWSDGTTTYQAKLSSLITAQGDMGTGAFRIPVGTTADRPASLATGMIRYNTTTSALEFYNGSTWLSITSTYTGEVLVVAGGGGGGLCFGGGGGAGGYIYNANYVFTQNNSLQVVVGSGGVGRSVNGGSGTQGGNSSIGLLTAIGGGGGGGGCGNTGGNGGSGGGGSTAGSNNVAGGSGTPGQGSSGASSPSNRGGGGGGAGSTGSERQGGNGLQNSITGTNRFYAGGGSGGDYPSSNNLAGGLGGGGTGGYFTSPGIPDATPNTGGGGGGGIQSGTSYSGNGGSGIVIVRYLGSQRATGGQNIYSITVNGLTYTVHEFTSTSGPFTFTA